MGPSIDDVDVRPVRPEELDVVSAHLRHRSRTQHARRITAQSEGAYRYLIAWLEGVAVGHVGLGFPNDRRVDELVEWRGLAVVDDLYVEPLVRRRGIGRHLMITLEAEALAADIPGIALDTGLDEGYAAARALYRDLGYEQVSGPFIGSARMPPDADTAFFVELLAIWTKRL